MKKVHCGNCEESFLEIISSKILADVYKCSLCGVIQIWGPCCGQGWVHPLKNLSINKIIYVCDECDTLWESLHNIGRIDFGGDQPINFNKYLDKNGIIDVSKELQCLPPDSISLEDVT